MDASTLDELARVLLLRDHNTRVVVAGTMLLGLAAGVAGTYMLLRRRALIGDALSHATLPGVALAFIVMAHLTGDGKQLTGLLVGAAVFGLLGVGAILLIKNVSRIKEDAALGIVLSVSFGLGVVLLGLIQKMPTGGQAGLGSFIEGNAAAMLAGDAVIIGGTAFVVLALCAALHKEFAILSFDVDFARAQGWPTGWLDLLMMTVVTAVTVVGLQAVGLILIIALLIIPAAAARFWTNHLRSMLVVSGVIGAGSALVGTIVSALFERLPAGAVIVVFAAAAFAFSALVGARGGLLVRGLAHLRLRRTVAHQHLLRAMYEELETADALGQPASAPMTIERLMRTRSWSGPRLKRVIAAARRRGLLARAGGQRGTWHLTDAGLEEAARIAGNHRLWEMYLITYADIAPSHVDRDADQIEHVLGETMVDELRRLLKADAAGVRVPPSPHRLAHAAGPGEDAP
ncbi:MAG: iron chelate uptake ABC transporter family permease subunit [Planctomycetes bacterium]|nr:iron chelate uptake ABC transporter family permease subunit [Planctomycetota bacterium]